MPSCRLMAVEGQSGEGIVLARLASPHRYHSIRSSRMFVLSKNGPLGSACRPGYVQPSPNVERSCVTTVLDLAPSSN